LRYDFREDIQRPAKCYFYQTFVSSRDLNTSTLWRKGHSTHLYVDDRLLCRYASSLRVAPLVR
jgi:hypothetical protein